MAHTKAGGSTKLGRDSRAKRLGIKKSDGQWVRVGNVIVRQRGTKWLAGKNTKRGADDTIFSLKDGKVKFSKVRKRTHQGKIRKVSQVEVISEQ